MAIPYAEVIGDPIAHSKSPLIHKFWLEKLGLEGDYRAVRVCREELGDYVASRRDDPDWRGCNVTMPHKESIAAFLDDVTAQAGRVGAVNLVSASHSRMIGENSDVTALRAELFELADTSARMELPVVVIGAGGAARAVLAVLAEIPDVEVLILNRSLSKARSLIHQFGLRGRALSLEAPLPAANLVVNASSLGMSGCPPLPLSLDGVNGALIVDLVYSPAETNLLRQARERGMSRTDGLAILIGQAREAFRKFFRIDAPFGTEPELREVLSR
jgi:shikimate dehydrogenase